MSQSGLGFIRSYAPCSHQLASCTHSYMSLMLEPFWFASGLNFSYVDPRGYACEQPAPGETTQISYEDKKGRWHHEVDSRTDRPITIVEG
jgi:hypothetical protein